MEADWITIDGVEPSARIRGKLTEQPVALAFSRGKDAIAAWLALREAGVQVKPYYFYLVPGLMRFEAESLDYFEGFFGQRIARYPHPSIYRWLNRYTFQAPERLALIEAARLPEPSYSDMQRMILQDWGWPADTWFADGVRAADSPNRRASIKKHGPMKSHSHKVSPIWDWRRKHTFQVMADHGVTVPVDYAWFGRSFDGIDKRFTGPLSRLAPDDYQKLLEWYPLADLDQLRYTLEAR